MSRFLLVVAFLGALAAACSHDGTRPGAGGASSTSGWGPATSTSTAASASAGASASASSGHPDCGDVGFNHAACIECARSSCCDALTICASGTPCHDYLGCIQGCALGDPPCEANCATLHPDGVPPADSMADCVATRCPIACKPEWNEVCDSTILYADLQCAQCLGDHCCLEYVMCAEPDPDACIRCVNGTGPCDAAGRAALACRSECAVECGADPGSGAGGAG